MASDVTRKFANWLAAWQVDDAQVAQAARLLLLDGLAVAAAGASEPSVGIAADFARQERSAPAASVIGHDFATSLSWAARVNGIAMHALDLEPMWYPANHAVSCVLPALLAIAEARERDGHGPQGTRLLQALAKGIEAQGRLRLSSGQLEPRDLSLHPPGAVGSIASAVAVAGLLGLGSDATRAAIGIASSRLGGALANVGSMTKALHCGDAAAHGLEAALLAARGFTADEDSLGSARGWGPTLFGKRFDPAPLTAPLEIPRILSPGPAWKLFPSQYATHFAITAALEARAAIPDPSSIAAVKLFVPDMPYIDRPDPADGLEGKFSWQYTVAIALLDGKVDRSSFSNSRRDAPDMSAMLKRIQVVPDSTMSGHFNSMFVEIRVTLIDGSELLRRCDGPIGSWQRPATAAAIEGKARELFGTAFGGNTCSTIMSMIGRPPEELVIGDLMSALRRPPDPPAGTIQGAATAG